MKAKLVFTGDRSQLEKIRKRARSVVSVYGIEVEFSDVKPKAVAVKKEAAPKKEAPKKAAPKNKK